MTQQQEQQEFIAHDWAGWKQNYGRFTHIPSGDTLLCKPYWGQLEWDAEQLEWFKKYKPELTVHECPAAYSTNDPSLGTVQEIIDKLQKRVA